MNQIDNKLTRIGVFYDGNYFYHVSNYYNYEHSRKARLSISGLHDFIRFKVAEEEGTDVKMCQVVDAHYFRGRISSYESFESNKLFAERIFDDILMNEGVVTHYLPLRARDGKRMEKGIDVWLALEAFELAIYKRFDVVALIACDSDYVPLIRKLNTLGTRVMVLGWDFEYSDERTGRQMKTIISLDLLEEVTYPISMHEIIDNKIQKNASVVNNLFVNKEIPIFNPTFPKKTESIEYLEDNGAVKRSTIHSLKTGFGFIKFPPNNLFFHWSNMLETDFNDLHENDFVEFEVAKGEKGDDVAVNIRRLDPSEVNYTHGSVNGVNKAVATE
jgi:cold shock CspA family protein/uncharacterized LabA/DUF88 family protein